MPPKRGASKAKNTPTSTKKQKSTEPEPEASPPAEVERLEPIDEEDTVTVRKAMEDDAEDSEGEVAAKAPAKSKRGAPKRDNTKPKAAAKPKGKRGAPKKQKAASPEDDDAGDEQNGNSPEASPQAEAERLEPVDEEGTDNVRNANDGEEGSEEEAEVKAPAKSKRGAPKRDNTKPKAAAKPKGKRGAPKKQKAASPEDDDASDEQNGNSPNDDTDQNGEASEPKKKATKRKPKSGICKPSGQVSSFSISKTYS
ncbi:hypothetical protein M3Y98_01028900 [Aphelenchoides besseyi]|nr:hypothetical protein M3Y98_01028900 [Aphelenchoides besseyi]